MSDLGRFSIHTSRKRLIELQRALNHAGTRYRSFDVYNLGRYERQFGLHRETVSKMLRFSVPPGYRRSDPVCRSKLDALDILYAVR